ncbi:MAG TPA: alkaline phosphatase family protein [Acidimicrobiales bacterium]|nr:alkaline phosphatase family protein [Acidimicrobiales bacterium]
MTLTRRDLLRGAAGVAAGFPLAKLPSRLGSARAAALGLPSNAPVDTIVVTMMENRSFDHYLGWLPGADGVQAGLTYLDDEGLSHQTQNWGRSGRNDFAGHGFKDPSHSWDGGRIQLGGIARDASGFMKGSNDEFALAYYSEEDLPVWAAFTRQGVVFDHYFTALMGPTYPNRYYMHAADSGGRRDNKFPSNPLDGYPETTIWDRLDAAGVSWTYYFSNAPVISLYGARFLAAHRLGKIRHISHYYADCLAGTLPNVAFVDPFFLADKIGESNDDHPHADHRLGQQFLAGVTRAFSSGPQWSRGALFVNYDEWGGFFDHVVPPSVIDPRSSTNLADDYGQLGFRCPAIAVSPWLRRGTVNHTQFEHTSILKFIEWRFGLPSLTARDANANNIGSAFDFEAAPDKSELQIPLYLAPPGARMPSLANAPTDHIPGQVRDRVPAAIPSSPAPWPVEQQPHLPDHPWPFPADGVNHPPVPTSASRPLVPTPSELWVDIAHSGLAERLGYRIDWKFEDSFFDR